LLLPALSRAKGGAGMTKCRNNLKQMGLSLQLYVTDTGGYPSWLEIGGSQGASLLAKRFWFNALEPITGVQWTNGTLWHCPANKFPEYPWQKGQEIVVAHTSYGYNGRGTEKRETKDLGLGNMLDPSYGVTKPSVKEGEVITPSDMIAVADYRSGLPLLGATTNLIGRDFMDGRAVWHDVAENVVFCDTHVEGIKVRNLHAPNDAARARWNHDHTPHEETWW
jgi:hypothetical protein